MNDEARALWTDRSNSGVSEAGVANSRESRLLQTNYSVQAGLH
jgi:hypothetical protein